jgi:hypothetical protein
VLEVVKHIMFYIVVFLIISFFSLLSLFWRNESRIMR